MNLLRIVNLLSVVILVREGPLGGVSEVEGEGGGGGEQVPPGCLQEWGGGKYFFSGPKCPREFTSDSTADRLSLSFQATTYRSLRRLQAQNRKKVTKSLFWSRCYAERIWGEFFVLVRRILGKLPANLMANFDGEF